MENDITQKAIARIAAEGIKTESRARANLRKFGFWIPVIFTVLLGSLAVAAIFFVLENNDWDLAGRFGAGFVFRSIPYFWLLLLVIFVTLGEFSYAKTAVGYRYGIIKTTLVYMLVTILAGMIFWGLGIGSVFMRAMAQRGFMHNIMFNQTEVWSHPGQGLLAGSITAVRPGVFDLTDFNGARWTIDFSHAFVRGRVHLNSGELVKIIGTASGTRFTAEEIRPWVGVGMMGGEDSMHVGGGYMMR